MKFDAARFPYIVSKPIHHTQRIADDDKFAGFHRNNPYVMDIENDDDVMLAAECPLGTE